jgi:hypothetical protein
MKVEGILFIMFSSRNRRYESGNEKRKKKQRLELAAQLATIAIENVVEKIKYENHPLLFLRCFGET